MNLSVERKYGIGRSIESVCIIPSVNTLKDPQMFLTYLTSHQWELDTAEAYGNDGILKREHCKHCGIERMVIVSELKESEARARDYRRKLLAEESKDFSR